MSRTIRLCTNNRQASGWINVLKLLTPHSYEGLFSLVSLSLSLSLSAVLSANDISFIKQFCFRRLSVSLCLTAAQYQQSSRRTRAYEVLCTQLNNDDIQRDFRFANKNCGSRLHLCCGLSYRVLSTADSTSHSIMTVWRWTAEILKEAVVM